MESFNQSVNRTAFPLPLQSVRLPQRWDVNIDRTKTSVARKWVDAVNNWGELGLWDYAVVKDLTKIEDVLERYTRK